MNLKYIPAEGKYPSDEDHWRFDSNRMPFIYHHPTNTLYYSDLGAFHYPILEHMGLGEEHGAELSPDDPYSVGEVDKLTGLQVYPPFQEPSQDVQNKALEIYNDLAYHKQSSASYTCPHCNDGPFDVDGWWDHMNNHPAWLQSRDPKDLERTDLGYGEDLKTTTVPTHDLPNEIGFTPDKFGAWKEAIWPFNKRKVAPWTSPWGVNMVPLKAKHEHFAKDIPYVYHQPSNTVYYLYPSGHHNELFGQLQNMQTFPGASSIGELTNGYSHTLYQGSYPDRNVINSLFTESPYYEGDEVDKTKTAAVPQAHRMVWLSQPNQDSLKYWHHNPSNTTYAWDSQKPLSKDGGDMHHWETAKHLGIPEKQAWNDAAGLTRGNDWEGGFWMKQMGRHPADLWGLPSQVDYAPIQGDGDYGMF